MDRVAVGGEKRHELRRRRRLGRAQLLHPLLALGLRALVDTPGGGREHRAEDRAGIADKPQGDVAVAPDGAVVEIDLHHLRAAAEPAAVAHAEIERRADDDDHVGLVEGIRARAVEVMGSPGGSRPRPAPLK